jgi:hypothetical protein
MVCIEGSFLSSSNPLVVQLYQSAHNFSMVVRMLHVISAGQTQFGTPALQAPCTRALEFEVYWYGA